MPYKDIEAQRECARRGYERHREERLARQRAYYEANPDHVRDTKRRSAQKNRERINAKARQKRLDHPPDGQKLAKERKQAREYREENREYCNKQKQNWDARQRGLVDDPRTGHWTSAEDRIVMREDISVREMVVMLQRSYASITTRQKALRGAEIGVCEHCGKTFPKVQPSDSHKPFYSRGKFCSRQCAYDDTKAVTAERNTRHCDQCGVEYVARSGRGRFCSLACSSLGQALYPPVPCPVCGVVFKPKTTWSTARGKVPTTHCSMKCAGEAKRRRTAQERATNVCEHCGKLFSTTTVRDGNPWPGARYCSSECRNHGRVDAIPEIVCETCGTMFRRRSQYPGHEVRFCSMECRRESRMQDCQHCGQRYMRHNPGQQYCSQSCAHRDRSDAIPGKTCETCGTVFYRRGATERSEARFCSRECRIVVPETPCETCGTMIRRRGAKFCSIACRDAGATKIDCETCGVTFSSRRAGRLDRGGRERFCSMACRRALRLRTCQHCGDQFAYTSNPQQKYCTVACRRGAGK